MPKRQLTLAEKIFAISARCATIERKGVAYEKPDVNGHAQPFPYARIEDVLETVNPLLKRYKLLLTGQVAKEPMTHVSKGVFNTEVLVDWTLIDLEWSLEAVYGNIPWAQVNMLTYKIPGAGCDDKGAGVSKALSNSRKQAYILIFNLRIADEPEEVPNAPRPQEGPTEHADAVLPRS